MRYNRTIQPIRINKPTKRVTAWLLTFALTVSLLSGMGIIRPETAQAAVALHNPTYDAATDTATWDCVWFGHYWQSDTNGDGVADKNDDKEPIKWRVLSVEGNDVFLLADTNLDVKPYNTEYTSVTWENCTLRSWLNGYGSSQNAYGTDYATDNFIDAAFSATEQAAIKNTNVVNEDNPYYGTEGGNDTVDKIYLLSIAEASNAAYGFNSTYTQSSDTRIALNTAYVAEYDDEGMSPGGNADWWWLRSPGYYSSTAAGVGGDGYGYDFGTSVTYDIYAHRPALHLTLSSSTPLSYAGMVCSDGTVNEQGGGSVSGGTPTSSAPTKAPEKSPSPTPGDVEPTQCPTATAMPTDKPVVTAVPTEKPSPTKAPEGTHAENTPAPGQLVKDTSTDAFYQIVSTGTGDGTVSYIRPEGKTKKATVPAVITYAGKKYKVTSLAEKAFAGNKKLKAVVIGKNVKTIQKKAFTNCKTLSKVTVKSKVLSKVGKNAFKGTSKKLTVKVPKKKKAKYQKLFKGKGNKKLWVK